MADISKVKLPSGNVYDIKDAVAREMISGGVSFNVGWDGTSVPDVTKIPAGVQVTYNGTTYTGTLSPESAQPGAFYLVKTSDENLNTYSEYVATGTTGSKFWEKLGDTTVDLSDLGELAYKDNATIVKGSGDNVLGEATTFTASSSAVSFSGGTTDKALGVDTTFSMTQPTISVTPSTTNIKATASGTAVGANGTASAITGYASPNTGTALGSDATFTTTVTPATTRIKATASGAAVGADGTAAAITGFGAHTTDTFVKSVTAETNKKLVTTSIVPTNGTVSASKVTSTTSNLETTSIPNVTSVGTASTWSFTMGSGADSETLIIGGSNSTTPTLGAGITAATGALTSVSGYSGAVTMKQLTSTQISNVDDQYGSTYNYYIATPLFEDGLEPDLRNVSVYSDSGYTTLAFIATESLIDGESVVAASSGDKNVLLFNADRAISGVSTSTTKTFYLRAGGAQIVDSVTIQDVTAAKVGSAVTVATGSATTAGTGAAVVTGVTVGSSAAAITALGTPTTSNCLTGVKMTSQPTISLSTGAASGTGVVSVATGITSAETVVNNSDTVTAITGLGTPSTATVLTGVKVTAQPTIALTTGATAGTGVISVATGISSATATGGAVNVGTNDQVTAVTGIGTGTAAAQTITVGTNDKVKVAKYDDLGVTVS